MESELSRPSPGASVVREEECIVSFTASRDASKLLLNMANRALHLWDVSQAFTAPATLLQKFRGASERHSRYGNPPQALPPWVTGCKVLGKRRGLKCRLLGTKGPNGTANGEYLSPKTAHVGGCRALY